MSGSATGNHEQGVERGAGGGAHTQGLSFAATENSARTCGHEQSQFRLPAYCSFLPAR